MPNFKKISVDKYYASNVEELVVKTDNIIREISLGLENYDQTITDMLFDNIFSRMLASHFNQDKTVSYGDLNFMTITTEVKDRSITISVGKVDYNGKINILNGVLYN
jgi:hypothetical protein